MPQAPRSQRRGLLPVSVYLPDWAQRLQALIRHYPGLRYHISVRTDVPIAAGSPKHSTRKPAMKLPRKLSVHDGGRAKLVHELQMSLFEGLLANDPALINHALSIDQRLAKRADLKDMSESGHSVEQISPQT